MILHPHQALLGGRIKCQVLEPVDKRVLSRKGLTWANRNGIMALCRVVHETPWQHNLVLDQGLDQLCSTYAILDAFAYVAAGTDGTATEAAASSNLSQTGTTVSAASPGTFDAGMVGKLIAWDADPDGTKTYITSYTNDQEVEVDVSQSVGAAAATIYNTDQTGLFSERGAANSALPYRSNTYLNGSCGTVHSATTATYVFTRTYDLSAQTVGVVYREIGFAGTGTVASNLFSRIRLSGDVTVNAGQQLRVVYELTLTIAPISSTAATPTITGWGALTGNGSLSAACVNTVGSDGLSDNATAGDHISPSVYYSNSPSLWYSRVWTSEDATAPASYEAATVDRSATAKYDDVNFEAYSAGNFYRDIYGIWTPSDGAWTVRSMGFGLTRTGLNAASTGTVYAYVMSGDQSKANTHSLKIVFRRSVNRLLA